LLNMAGLRWVGAEGMNMPFAWPLGQWVFIMA
jgi:hypothetical protein